MGTILSLAPTVTIRRKPNGDLTAWIPGSTTQFCALTVFIDGFLSSWEAVHRLVPDAYRLVEVYNDWRKVPRQFVEMVPGKDPCGAAVFWTYNVKW